jgi:hypothetical protein
MVMSLISKRMRTARCHRSIPRPLRLNRSGKKPAFQFHWLAGPTAPGWAVAASVALRRGVQAGHILPLRGCRFEPAG